LCAQEAKPKPRPAWLHDQPIVLVSNHDSMPIFRRRVGGNTTFQEEDYEKEHTEEAVRKLKELGVTVVIVHFYLNYSRNSVVAPPGAGLFDLLSMILQTMS
jgi:hypothetical protein